jgi:transcriptional regulator with XRE-family HTH domain
MTPAERIIKEIDSKGITAYRIEKDLAISAQTVQIWRKGKVQPSYKKMVQLCDYLGLKMENLLNENATSNENIEYKDKLTTTNELNEMVIRLQKENKDLKEAVTNQQETINNLNEMIKLLKSKAGIIQDLEQSQQAS